MAEKDQNCFSYPALSNRWSHPGAWIGEYLVLKAMSLWLIKDMNCATILSRELESSSLVCDCRLEWFVRWMSTRQKGSRLRLSELAVCGLPSALKGTLLKELTLENLHCGECWPQKSLICFFAFSNSMKM